MYKLFKTLPIAAILAGTLVPQPLWADTASDQASLEQRLDSLEQQVAQLKQELHEQKQAAAQYTQITNQTPPVAYVTANSKDGFAIKSADGDYTLKIGGYTQVEGREFGSGNKEDLQADKGSSTSYDEDSAFLLRRARLIIQGTIAGKFDYFLQPDFGYNDNFSSITATSTSSYAPALQDAWIDYRYSPDFAVKVGKMKTPFDLENLQDSRYTDFTELGLTGNLGPQRDIGVQAFGNLYWDWITYNAGVFNGAADHENPYGGTSTTGYENGNITGLGRVFVTPFKDTNITPLKGLGVGFAASYGKEKGADIPSAYVTTGQAPFFSYNSGVENDGPQLRTEPQAYYYYKSLGILAEKVNDYEALAYKSGNNWYRDRPDNKAYNVEASYVLTGENASYNGVTPKYDLDPSIGHWGAFELAARYGELKEDPSIFSENFANLNTSASEATAWSAGINWYLNKNAKIVFDYEQTKFDRGAAAGVNGGNRKTENLFITMFQLSIG
jgi:phosphate-selective porin OprO and OprP